jgi:hypothetical protein
VNAKRPILIVVILIAITSATSAIEMTVSEVNPTDILASTALFGGVDTGGEENAADVTSDIGYVFTFGRLYFFRQSDLTPLWKTPFAYDAEFGDIRTDRKSVV